MKKRSSIIHGDMAIQWASTVISYVHDAEGLPLCEQLDYYCIDYLNKAVLPHKKTILHDYIEAVIIDSYSYMLDKHFPGEVMPIWMSVRSTISFLLTHLVKDNFGLIPRENF